HRTCYTHLLRFSYFVGLHSCLFRFPRFFFSTCPTRSFGTPLPPADPTTTAPDGSAVRVLLELAGGGMAHFALAPGETAKAVCHRTVEEIWFILSGSGEMWREQAGGGEGVGPSSRGRLHHSPATRL